MEFVRCGENPVCLCDVDRTLVDIALGHLQKAGFDTAKIRCYADYRKMIDENPHLDAVCVSTPDHMHAAQRFDNAAANALIKPYIRPGWEF
jgi:predicted dehydrogenase